VSFAGLTYLTLWLCAKFSIAFPYIPPCAFTHDRCQNMSSAGTKRHSIREPHPGSLSSQSPSSLPSLRNQAAAPPIYLLVIAAIPIACATYIASTRWVDHRHTGFDVFCGALLGIFFAWLGFRLYNPPLGFPTGWAWAPRNRDRAFSAGIGFTTWAGGEVISSDQQPNPHSVTGGPFPDRRSRALADVN
jgi:hypothetical protein